MGVRKHAVDFNETWRRVKEQVLITFTNHYSPSVQNTLYLTGKAVLERFSEIDKIHFSSQTGITSSTIWNARDRERQRSLPRRRRALRPDRGLGRAAELEQCPAS